MQSHPTKPRTCGLRAFAPALALLALVLALPSACGGADGGESAIVRGRTIYHTGTSASGDDLGVFLPLLGDRDRRFPAHRYACVNCHGEDGLPSLEAGVGVPNIQAHRLGGAAHAGAGSTRSRPAYDRVLLQRAIRSGIDAGGNRLNVVMPRFDISDRDLDDLLAYLATLGQQQFDGVDDTHCDIGLVVPEPGVADGDADDGAIAAAVATVRAFVGETDARGGIYGRSLRLVEHTARQWQAELEAGRGPLCLLAFDAPVDLVGGDVPVLVFGGQEPLVEPPVRPRTFHLHPSQAQQLCVAVDHVTAVLQQAEPEFVLALPADAGADGDALEQRVRSQVERAPGATVRRIDARRPGHLAGTATLLLAGDAEAKGAVLQLLATTSPGHLPRAIYCTHKLPVGALAQLDPAVLERLRLLLPVPLPPASSPAVAAFQEFLRGHDLPETAVSQRVTALASGIVLSEGLKRCGTRVSRTRLVRELGLLHQLPAGLFAPVTFAGGRHVGVRGAQVVRIDAVSRAVVPCSDWSEPR